MLFFLSLFPLSFPGKAQILASFQTWRPGTSPAGAEAARLLTSDYTFASCFPKCPDAAMAKQAAGEPTAAEVPAKPVGGSAPPALPCLIWDSMGKAQKLRMAPSETGQGVTCTVLALTSSLLLWLNIYIGYFPVPHAPHAVWHLDGHVTQTAPRPNTVVSLVHAL